MARSSLYETDELHHMYFDDKRMEYWWMIREAMRVSGTFIPYPGGICERTYQRIDGKMFLLNLYEHIDI